MEELEKNNFAKAMSAVKWDWTQDPLLASLQDDP